MDAYRLTLEVAIRSRWRDECWYRRNRWADWPDLRKANVEILRALLQLRREAKRVEAAATEHREREARRLFEEWTETERAVAYGYA